MPSLFVAVEIIGASELGDVGRELSLETLIDIFDLGPSRKSTGVFCSWRLQLNGDEDRKTAGGGQWKVERGQASGRTQVHDTAASSGILVNAFDAVWSHPIDLQLVWNQPARSQPLPSTWPHLQLQLMSIDSLQRTFPSGQASVTIPMSPGERLLELPLVAERPSSTLDSLARMLNFDPSTSSVDTVVDNSRFPAKECVGTVHVRVGVMMHGFGVAGVKCT